MLRTPALYLSHTISRRIPPGDISLVLNPYMFILMQLQLDAVSFY